MHYSFTFLKKKRSFFAIYRVFASQCHRHDHHRLISTKSPTSRFNVGWKSNYKNSESSLTSGIVVGLSLGVCYFTSENQPNTHFAYADLESHDPSSESEKKPKYLFADSFRRKVFFKYEKRIRTQSPPEKVFIRRSKFLSFQQN